MSYSITINTATHTLAIFNNGKLLKSYSVAIGKPSTPTPTGSYKIINKAVNPGGPFGSRWLGLNIPAGGFGIHGTNTQSSIGKSVSHGCIRMFNNDVLEVYRLIPIGTVVKIV